MGGWASACGMGGAAMLVAHFIDVLERCNQKWLFFTSEVCSGVGGF